MKVLIIEDEVKVAAFLKNGLTELGHQADVAYDGLNGQKLFSQKDYDIVILDVVLPNANGIEVCNNIKAHKPGTPVIMLSALGTTDDKLAGFDAGADDYLIKPFAFQELVARLKVLLKRESLQSSQATTSFLNAADLTLDLDKKIALRQNRTITLTAKEFALLSYLMKNKNKVVSRADIAENVWDSAVATGNVVEVYVNILRKKIDHDFPMKLIQTRIGLGYTIVDV